MSALLLNTPMSLPSRGVASPIVIDERAALPWGSPDTGRRLAPPQPNQQPHQQPKPFVAPMPPHPATGTAGGSPATRLSPGDRGAATED